MLKFCLSLFLVSQLLTFSSIQAAEQVIASETSSILENLASIQPDSPQTAIADSDMVAYLNEPERIS